jgi:hypothetical protein
MALLRKILGRGGRGEGEEGDEGEGMWLMDFIHL